MAIKTINVEKDFSRYPAGRYLSDGPYSGQAFREKLLLPALGLSNEKLVIELDGARGYGSSFLEEAFGGLLRAGLGVSDILGRIEFKTSDASLIVEIKSYIDDQAKVSVAH